MAAQKFRKKPVEIEAMPFRFYLDAPDIVEWIKSNGGSATYGQTETGPVQIHIQTLEGVMAADVSDWIIRGVAGEFYPCKPDIFGATYDPVAD